MSQIVSATFVDGAFRPDQEILLASGTKVRLVIEPCEELAVGQGCVDDEFNRVFDELDFHSPDRWLTRNELHERD